MSNDGDTTPPEAGGIAKRVYDVLFSSVGLVFLSPLFLVVAALIKMTDGEDVFYRQLRVGLRGRPFRICKFRTMVSAADKSGPAVTRGGDSRVTEVGRILRKTKLDELPQLWNVLKGEMSLVGPRPEVPGFVQQYSPEQRSILNLKPGITDLASLCFRDEESLLSHAGNVEEFYIQQCVPRKLRLNGEYATRANLLSDTWIILQTLCPYWVGVLLTYGIILSASCWLSNALVHGAAFADPLGSSNWLGVLLMIGVQLGCLTWHRQCRALLSYFAFPELWRVSSALGLAALGTLLLSAAIPHLPAPNVIAVDAFVSIVFINAFRSALRYWRENAAPEMEDDTATGLPIRVGIIGAGTTGAKLALEIAGNKQSGRVVVAFFDDDFLKWRKYVHDIPVVGMPECLLQGWSDKLDEVVIAMTNAPADRSHEIEQLLRNAGLKVHSISRPGWFWNWRAAA